MTNMMGGTTSKRYVTLVENYRGVSFRCLKVVNFCRAQNSWL